MILGDLAIITRGYSVMRDELTVGLVIPMSYGEMVIAPCWKAVSKLRRFSD